MYRRNLLSGLWFNTLPSVKDCSRSSFLDEFFTRQIGKSRRQTNLAQISALGSDLSDPWWTKYETQKIELKPQQNYVALVHGISRLDADGTGIGIVLQENDKIVWMAQHYYPKPRISFEAMYCAVVLTLRVLLQGFGLSKVIIQIPDEVVHGQINETILTEKVKQRMLREEVRKLQRDHVSSVTFQLTSRDCEYKARELARNSLEEKCSVNLEVWSDYTTCPPSTDDPMDDARVDEFLSQQKTTDVVIDPSKSYYLRSDGASNGDPSVGGAGWVCYNDQGQELWYGRKFLGENISACEAELRAINLGLSFARSLGIERIHCELDAKGVVEGFQGVREVDLGNFYHVWTETLSIVKEFKSFTLQYIPRDLNKRADYLCRKGEDRPYD